MLVSIWKGGCCSSWLSPGKLEDWFLCRNSFNTVENQVTIRHCFQSNELFVSQQYSLKAWIIVTSAVLWSGRDERKPNIDLPNQEKNQYWRVYWWETGALYTQGINQGSWSDLLERGNWNWLRCQE